MTEETRLSFRVSRTTDRHTDDEHRGRRSHESHTSEHATVEVVAQPLGERTKEDEMHAAKHITDEFKFLGHIGKVGARWRRTAATASDVTKVF